MLFLYFRKWIFQLNLIKAVVMIFPRNFRSRVPPTALWAMVPSLLVAMAAPTTLTQTKLSSAFRPSTLLITRAHRVMQNRFRTLSTSCTTCWPSKIECLRSAYWTLCKLIETSREMFSFKSTLTLIAIVTALGNQEIFRYYIKWAVTACERSEVARTYIKTWFVNLTQTNVNEKVLN